MSLHKMLLVTSLAGFAVGCGSDDGKSDGTTDGTKTCNLDFAKITAGAPTISFKDDIMPIFGLSCVSSECHNVNENQPKADLVLGVGCEYDAAAKWKCTFPQTSQGPDLVKDKQPLTQEVIDQVAPSILAASKTVASLKRVEPGHPETSFLVDKISDQQNKKSYTAECQNQDTSKSKDPCGTFMPLVGSALCIQGTSGQSKFDAVVQWIAQGAPTNN